MAESDHGVVYEGYDDPTGKPVPKTSRRGYGILGSDSTKTGRVIVGRGLDPETDLDGPNDIGIDYGEA